MAIDPRFIPQFESDPEQTAVAELRRRDSVMAGPDERSYVRRALDFAFGETPEERITNIGPGAGIGSAVLENPYAKVGASLLPKEGVSQAVRGIGREMMQYLRNLTRHGEPPLRLGFSGSLPGAAHVRERVAGLNPIKIGEELGVSPTRTLEHELGHIVYRDLPYSIRDEADTLMDPVRRNIKAYTKPIKEGLDFPARMSRVTEQRGYLPGTFMDPSEFYAIASETPTTLAGQLLTPQAKMQTDKVRRIVRGMIKAKTRQGQ